MRPTSGLGATPIDPKNGASRSVDAGRERRGAGARVEPNELEARVREVVGSVPLPGRNPVTP